MMKTALLVLCCAMLTTTYGSVLITGFGEGEFEVTSFLSGTTSQTRTSSTLTGTDLGATMWGSLPAVVDISGNTSFLLLVGTLWGSDPGSKFQISLFDTDENEALYEGEFVSFASGSATNVTLAAVDISESFSSRVQSLGIMTSGLGAGFNLTVDSLYAVPEPSSASLLGLGVLGVLMQRCRS